VRDLSEYSTEELEALIESAPPERSTADAALEKIAGVLDKLVAREDEVPVAANDAVGELLERHLELAETVREIAERKPPSPPSTKPLEDMIVALRKRIQRGEEALEELAARKPEIVVPLPAVTIVNEPVAPEPRKPWVLAVTETTRGFMRTVVASCDGVATYVFGIQRDAEGFLRQITATPIDKGTP